MELKQKHYKALRKLISNGWFKLYYEQDDYGTERRLTVVDYSNGEVIGVRDPFLGGVPVNPMIKQSKQVACACDMIADKFGLKALGLN